MKQQILPRHLPCRINDRETPDLMVTALGEVKTPLTQGVFDRLADRLKQRNGRVIGDFFKRRLGVRYYKPLDSRPLPPAGWCSWGYYERSITPEEVMVNARWIHNNMKDYGVSLILLDDGWPAGQKDRDWTTLAAAFRGAMGRLAHDIHKLGQMPGIWICPHGHDNERVARAAGCFLFKSDGSPAGGTFGGPFTVDATHPKARSYWRDLIGMLTAKWGYDYLKLDAIHSNCGYGVLETYKENQQCFHDPSVPGEEAFRRSLRYIREAAGPNVIIGGCGVLTFEAAGLCETCRTGGDVLTVWWGFSGAINATMNGYFMHRLVWLSDPDYVLVRPPMTMDMARARVSLVGLTGQQLYFGDRLPSLGPERVALLKKIAPSAPIRPFDLFSAARWKRMIDLKVGALGRSYDVVGMFNYDDRQQAANEWLKFSTLGLPENRRFYVYDFWAADVLGVCKGGVNVDVPQTGCRVLTIMPETDTPVLLSTTRHITQGWPDLVSLTTSRRFIKGRSRVIGGEPYALTFGLAASGRRIFDVKRVKVAGEPHPDVTVARVSARVAWIPRRTGEVDWRVEFGPAMAIKRRAMTRPYGSYGFTAMPSVRDIDPWTVELSWIGVLVSSQSVFVKMDGRLLGHVFGDRCRIGGLVYGSRHRFEVGVTDIDGFLFDKSAPHVDARIGAGLPRWMYLSDLPWTEATSGYHTVKQDRSVCGGALSCHGRKYPRGLGTCAVSRIVYPFKGLFRRLRGAAGMEDVNGAPASASAKESGSAVFRIRGDGRVLWGPVQMLHGGRARPFDVDVRGIRSLELCADLPKHRTFAPHADWLEAQAELADD